MTFFHQHEDETLIHRKVKIGQTAVFVVPIYQSRGRVCRGLLESRQRAFVAQMLYIFLLTNKKIRGFFIHNSWSRMCASRFW